MIIRNGTIVSDTDIKINKISKKNFDVYYKGFVFTSGKKCGEESVLHLVGKLLSNPEEIPFKEIYGNYFVYVVDHIGGKQYVFSDNSGFFIVYRYKDCLATSFLELIDFFDEISLNDLDLDGISEFLQLGFPFFGKTMVNGITRINGNEFFKWNHGQVKILSKGLSGIEGHPNIDMNKFFADLIYSLKGNKISLDLTGGFDSRLVLSYFLKNNAKFELATSGTEDHIDLVIAKNISQKIGVEHFPSIHSVGKFSDDIIQEIFELTDSQIDVLLYHSTHQSNNNRVSRNVDVSVNGVGGELYKDFWWLQDFPFYNKKNTDLEKLYTYRIRGILFPIELMGEKLRDQNVNLKQNILSGLSPFIRETNTRSYDNIYFNIKMNASAGVYMTSANNYFSAYAPLLELEMVKIGFNLKRSERFFNNFHRKIISKNNQAIAKIRTTEGITASSSSIYIFSDFYFYVHDKLKRGLKLVYMIIGERVVFLPII
jgi:hypothetical protein